LYAYENAQCHPDGTLINTIEVGALTHIVKIRRICPFDVVEIKQILSLWGINAQTTPCFWKLYNACTMALGRV